jgi:branched-chain amino acid transport system ATP-binding protein
MNGEPLLALRGVHTCYGHIHALKGVSIEVGCGEIVTLLGANGAGKSTVLRTVSGLLKPREGEVLLRGRPVHGVAAHAIAALGIGHVPEGRRIFARMTVEENLDVGAYLEKNAKTVADRKARVFGMFPRLGERRGQLGGTLSGGEQQMLAIGRALMQDPEMLLLDEPTMGLAPVLVDQIFDVVVNLNRMGKTILLVEQNAWHALKIAHRGYVLQTGVIILHGAASDLVRNPQVRESYLGAG